MKFLFSTNKICFQLIFNVLSRDHNSWYTVDGTTYTVDHNPPAKLVNTDKKKNLPETNSCSCLQGDVAQAREGCPRGGLQRVQV